MDGILAPHTICQLRQVTRQLPHAKYHMQIPGHYAENRHRPDRH